MKRILLDTSFILPILGISVSKEVDESSLKISKYELYISRFSILESLRIIIRLLRRGVEIPISEIEYRLKALVESNRFKITVENSKILSDALKIYLLGHNDLIDCLLYSTAINLNLQFLTIDEEFRRFIKRVGLKDVTITLQDIL